MSIISIISSHYEQWIMQHKHPCTDKITVIFIMVLFPLKYNTYSIIVILYPCCPALNTKFSNLYPNFNLNIPQLTSHHFPPHSSYCYFLLYSDTSIPFFWIMFVLWIVILPPATLNEFAIPLRLFFFLLRFFRFLPKHFLFTLLVCSYPKNTITDYKSNLPR